MKKISVVVLNYLNYKDTIECVNSLIDYGTDNLEIVIVDNCSTNESWCVLSEKFNHISNVHQIKTNINEGFARGNNVGILYSRETLGIEYVLVLNNDTIVNDPDFFKILLKAHDEGVAIVGPSIVGLDDSQQNPIFTKVTKVGVQQHLKLLKSFKLKIYQSKIYIRLRNTKLLIFLRNIVFNLIGNKTGLQAKRNMDDDYILHGACFLLTPDFFAKYPYLFPGTFLYYEENILALLCDKANIKWKYITETSILHKEDQSSIMSFKNKNSIKIKYEIDSVNSCLELFELGYNEILFKYFE